MDKAELVKLCGRSWCVKALALIGGGVPARISPVAHAAGCGRTAMTASFQLLLDLGLLVRAPGHGHPLRPEFALSERGRVMADWARKLDGYLDGEADWRLVRRSWVLPVLSQLDRERRFADLRKALAPVTDRALSLTLTELAAAGWIRREVDSGSSPPAVRYAATARAAPLVRHLALPPGRGD